MFSRDDLPKLDLTKLDLTKFDLPKFDLSKLDLPKLDLPKLDLPKLDLPSTDLADRVDVDRLVNLARDAAYVGVGATVVAARAADRRGRAMADRVTTRLRRVAAAVA